MKRIIYKKFLLYTRDFIFQNIDNENLYNKNYDLKENKEYLHYITRSIKDVVNNISTKNNSDMKYIVYSVSDGVENSINNYNNFDKFEKYYNRKQKIKWIIT